MTRVLAMAAACLGLELGLGLGLPLPAAAAPAWRFDPGPYQDRQGAITVHTGGDFADPYFAIRALLVAHHAGADIAAPADALIAWLLPRQEADGSFARYCRQPDQAWRACAEADADDALLAIWAELLHVRSACASKPPAWRTSANRALAQLATLRDPVRGTYRISAAHTTSLLMDNVEIYAALQVIAARQPCMGEPGAARAGTRAAQRLHAAIERTFRIPGSRRYRVSTQALTRTGFYPDQVAQVYPLLFGLPDTAPARARMQSWLDQHGQAWLTRQGDNYPWGLVALAAHEAGLSEAAVRWLHQAAPLRFGRHWNVLEEAAFQSLCAQHAEAVPCRALGAGAE